jgi:hypothetical protein
MWKTSGHSAVNTQAAACTAACPAGFFREKLRQASISVTAMVTVSGSILADLQAENVTSTCPRLMPVLQLL